MRMSARPPIPQSVRDVIARRLRHLSEECNRVLVLASVLGREFALEALARLAGVSEDELARHVRPGDGGPGRLRCSRESRAASASPTSSSATRSTKASRPRRVRLHRLAVKALELLYGEEPGPHLAELAHHAVAGSEFDKGVRYACRAGDRALALLAYEEAARLYSMALDALELSAPDDETMRCELLLLLGEGEIRAGNSPAAKEAFLGAAEIARRLGLPREIARAALGYGGRIIFGAPGATSGSCPCSRKGSRRCRRRGRRAPSQASRPPGGSASR